MSLSKEKNREIWKTVMSFAKLIRDLYRRQARLEARLDAEIAKRRKLKKKVKKLEVKATDLP